MNKYQLTWVQGLVLVLFILVVYMILTRLFGHFATDLAIMLGLFTLLFANQYQLNREMGVLQEVIRHNFRKVREDIDDLKPAKR